MESERNIRIMAFHGDLLIFRCSRSRYTCSDIAFWKMSFKPDLSKFLNKEYSTTSMYKSSSREADIVHCATAVDIRTRQKVPCVLLRLIKTGTRGFKYMLYSLNSLSRASLHAEFTVPYEIRDNVSVLCGPVLVWSHENMIFCTSPQTGEVKKVPILLTVNFIGELPLWKRELIVVGSQMHASEDMGDQVNVTEGSKTLLYFLEDGRTLNGACLFPDAYNSLIQCMVLLSAEDVGGLMRSTVLAATCRKQLLRFVNGLPEDMCLLPYEDPQSIQIVHTGASSCLLAVIFNHGNVCVVWKDTFKVAGCWSGVSLLLVDDFVGCGSDQMLLLFDELGSVEDCPGEFLLTDLCGIHYSRGRTDCESANPGNPVQENILLTVQALDSRLQSGLAFLQELQRDLSVKDQVLQQSIRALADLVLDMEHQPSPPQQEGLASLWDEESEEDVHVLNKPRRPDPECPLVQRMWYRVVDQSLVFGLLLTPSTGMVDKKMIGSVLWEPCGGGMAPAVVQSWSKMLWYPQPLPSPSEGPPAAKRSRPPSGLGAHEPLQQTLVIVTQLTPLFTFGTVTCSVWVHCSSNITERAGRPCFLVNLDTKEVLQGKFRPPLLQDCSSVTDEAREDLLCLLAAFDSWLLQIESTGHTVVDVGACLEERLGARRVEASPQYLLRCSAHGATLFHWQICGPFQGLLGVHCSDRFSMLELLNSLCDYLPASHHIEVLHGPTPQGVSQHLTCRLDTEMQTITEGVASVLQEEDVKGFDGTRDPACPEQLQSQREEWQSEREKGRSRLRPLVNAERYRSLVEKMIQAQLDGDISAQQGVQLVRNQGFKGPSGPVK
ncbi:Fanconi anemia group B protein [Brachyhypopomus gauderio]|uniref:Fanconi anemia group B protein n=1 Tax=Brachyhypopomus gauderio TaxID=698409 RepID=UPI00404185AE